MLRGINVGGHRQIKMESLKALYASLTYEHIISYIQSGNLIFTSAQNDPHLISEAISAEIDRVFNLSVTVMIRTVDEFDTIISSNPFLKQKNPDIKSLYVVFLATAPLHIPDTTKDGADEFVIADRNIYLFCPNGYGKTKFSNPFIERKLGVNATTRNWKTVTKLFDLATTPG
jgi:uncharacterized protein (DUF1697 family)